MKYLFVIILLLGKNSQVFSQHSLVLVDSVFLYQQAIEHLKTLAPKELLPNNEILIASYVFLDRLRSDSTVKMVTFQSLYKVWKKEKKPIRTVKIEPLTLKNGYFCIAFNFYQVSFKNKKHIKWGYSDSFVLRYKYDCEAKQLALFDSEWTGI